MNFSIRVTGAAPDSWLNHRQLALVCEGGGQRGIFTAGILDTFIKHDYFPFCTMIGVSAGAQNLSSYACGALGYARQAITRYTTNKAFFDPLRFARGGHLIDLDWYFDALHKEMPLDLDRGIVRLAGRSLLLVASRRDTLEAAFLPFRLDSWHQAVKASSAIPLFYRGGVVLNGVDYWDGGVADALPVQAAYARGSDCIVVIRTMPHDSGNSRLTIPERLKRGRLQEMAALVESHVNSYQTAQSFMEHPPATVKVIEISPDQPLKSRLLGSNPEALRHDYRIGQACGRAFLEHYAWRLRCVSNPAASEFDA